MHKDFQMFSVLEKSEAYKRLMVLWMQDLTDIESRRDSSASRGQESAWRYWAGQEKGYKRAMMRLNQELTVMEEDGGETLAQPSEMIEKLLSEARGDKK